MEYFINDEIKAKTLACEHRFACLQAKKECFCQITSTINNNKIFIICQHECQCNYKHYVEERVLCTCPVRLEIYKKYNI